MSTKQPKTAVLGAGIMGLMSAEALSASGHNVTLFDPEGFPAKNASWIAGGMLAPYSEIEHMNIRWVEAGLHSIRIWKDLLKTAPDCDFKNAGSLLIAHPEDTYILERFRAHLPQKPGIKHLNAQDTKTLEPHIGIHLKNSILLEEEAHLHPQKTIQYLLENLRVRGVSFQKQKLDIKEIRSAYDFIIDCRGMGAAKDTKTLRGVKGEVLLVRNPDFKLTRPLRIMHPRYPLYIIPRADQTFLIGATNIESAEDKTVSLRSAMELMSALYSLAPGFGDAQILEIAADIRPAYPDNLPRITRTGNVISANGLFRHGFLLAPVMAECIAAMTAEKTHEYEPLLTHHCHSEALCAEESRSFKASLSG